MKVELIYNPTAGQRDIEDDLGKAVDLLESQGWQVQVRETTGPGHAVTLAQEASKQGADLVVAVGGDGTIGEVATGLVGTGTLMGVFPVGTGNLWAHMVGLPVWSPMYRSALIDAARVLLQGERRKIDLGRAKERYFMLWSGIGFDAQVAKDVEPHREMRRSLGNITYAATAMTQALSMRGTRMTIVVDGRAMRYRVLLILVSNAQLYGPSLKIAPQAQLDDGLLDVYIFKGNSVLDAARHLFLLLVGKHGGSPQIEVFLAKRVQVVGDKPLPLHLDGDPEGYTPVTIEVAPQAVEVIIPGWASDSLFKRGGPNKESEVTLGARIIRRLRYEHEHWRDEGERIRQKVEEHLGIPFQD